MPWQQFLLREGCARRNGRWRYRTLLTVVARQNGKTLLAAIRILGGLCLFGERLALGCAQNRSVALECWENVLDIAAEQGLSTGKPIRTHGMEVQYVNGGRYRVVASTIGAARGISGVDLVLMDEVRMASSWDGYGAIDKTRRARPNSQLWAITTEGDMNSVVLNRLQTMAKDAMQEDREIPLGYWEWSAAPGDHPGKPDTWAKANPALGYTLEPDVVQAEFETDPAQVFEVEVLCRKVQQIEEWISAAAWDACTSTAQFPTDHPFAIAVEAGPELRHISIVAGAFIDGWHHLELISEHTDLADAETRLDSLLSRWKPFACVTLAKSPVEASVGRLATSHRIPHTVVRPAEFARACRAFFAAAQKRTLRHPGGSAISQALASTKRGPDGLVSSVHRLNPESDNDAALAAILAMWVPTQAPEAVLPNWTIY